MPIRPKTKPSNLLEKVSGYTLVLFFGSGSKGSTIEWIKQNKPNKSTLTNDMLSLIKASYITDKNTQV
ncbi:hypothetical protein F7018_05370 [Tenacibaculum aiptasiae]|uniref:Uncharacterized protein n=1 Tax=Tenacibaculum aiptasiae TaxID=426481 RepID=A0A7J5AQ81_9FLAO|nr:hypothetical protein [Tenacibaculum aiptasiae]KAB1159740.1 hypothetical protein F7018_05370 [Tenacibaculum aiptasiae]